MPPLHLRCFSASPLIAIWLQCLLANHQYDKGNWSCLSVSNVSGVLLALILMKSPEHVLAFPRKAVITISSEHPLETVHGAGKESPNVIRVSLLPKIPLDDVEVLASAGIDAFKRQAIDVEVPEYGAMGFEPPPSGFKGVDRGKVYAHFSFPRALEPVDSLAWTSIACSPRPG